MTDWPIPSKDGQHTQHCWDRSDTYCVCPTSVKVAQALSSAKGSKPAETPAAHLDSTDTDTSKLIFNLFTEVTESWCNGAVPLKMAAEIQDDAVDRIQSLITEAYQKGRQDALDKE